MSKNGTQVVLFVFGLALFFLAACQSNKLVPGSLLPTTPTLLPTATPTILPTETLPPTLPPPTILPTPLPTHTPTLEPVWSILFTGAPCEKTSSSCKSMGDSPPIQNYFINSDSMELRPLVEIEGISDNISTSEIMILSPDQNRIAVYTDDQFLIVDVDGNEFFEVMADIEHFYPFGFFGDDPDCLAGFDKQRETEQQQNGEVVILLYKSCIGDREPTLIDMAALPIDHTRLQFSLSPEGDKWLVYNLGLLGGDAPAALYVKEVMGDSDLPQQIFQEEFASCTPSIHWQDNETIEFLFATCQNNDLATYFYVIDLIGQELNLRYTLPTLEIPPSESYASTRYYGPVTGDWYADDNLFIFSPSTTGSLPPSFNGLYVLNLITGEIQQILSDTVVFAVRPWLQSSTNEE